MKNLLLILILFIATSCGVENSRNHTSIEWEQLPSFVDTLGRSAAYAAIVDGDLVVAGGCNFPAKPASEGGQKKFYSDIYTLQNGAWELSSLTLPQPSAYGVSVQIDDEFYLVGGTADGKTSLTSIYRYSPKELTTLSPMPQGRDNMGGAVIGSSIYVVGGLSNGVASNDVMVYDTQDDEWSEIAPLPGEPRVQPIVVAQNAAEEMRLYVWGGFNPTTKKVLASGFAYSPRLGEWMAVESLPKAMAGGVGTVAGVHSIIVGGGVDQTRFEYGLAIKSDSLKKDYMTRSPQWYNFGSELYSYNTIVDRWTKTGDIPVARAGATLATNKNDWFMVMGETMPGVRSAQVWGSQIVSQRSFGWINWSVIVVYLLAMIGMGVFFMFRAKSSDDFFRASGRIPWWAVSVSIFATMLSAITFMAIPAKTYATDWKYFLMAITIFIAAFPVVKYYLPFFRRLNITSAYEYLELRFSCTLRTISSVLFIFFMTARMALVLYLPSLALVAATGIDIYSCILLMSLITIIYSSIGGVEAVVWGDVVQGIILMGGALFTLAFLITNTNGEFMQIALDNDKFNILNFDFDFTNATFWVVVIGGIASQVISYSSDQTVIQRYMTVKSEKLAAKSIITNGVMSIISSLVFYMIGTALFTYFQSQPQALDVALPTADSIFPFFIMTKLPVGIAGVLVAAIFAASMSTVSSNINSIATAYTVDIHRFVNPNMNDKQKLKLARWASVVFGVLGCGFALLMATWNILSLFDWFNTMLGLLTSGLGALFLMGIAFDRIGGRSALVGFVLGTAILLIISIYTNLSFLMYGFVGMTTITIISLITSFILPRQERNLDGLTWKLRPKAK